MLRYFNFEPSFKLQWCCVLEDNYMSNKFQCTANLLHSGTLNPPLQPIMPYGLVGLVITFTPVLFLHLCLAGK